jgi:magnesium transporter
VVSIVFGDWQGGAPVAPHWHLGLVIALAMMANILIAGFAGVFVPLTLDRFEIDPAIASSIFVTMTTDSMGFLVFLGLAAASGLVG